MQSDIYFDPYAHLLQGLSTEVIERIVAEEILTHRRLVDEAQAFYEQLINSDQNPAAEPVYLSKMIAALAQQGALSALLDVLGYIPEVLGEKPH